MRYSYRNHSRHWLLPKGGIILFRKLKIRLTLINLVLLSIVLIIVFSGIYTFMEKSIDNQAKTLMVNAARRERIFFPNNIKGPTPPDEKRVLSNSFFIKTNFLGKITEISSNVPMTLAEANTLIKDTLKDSKAFPVGTYIRTNLQGSISYKSATLQYFIMVKPYGYILVFLDNSHDKDFLNWLILAFLIIGSISLVLVFAISLFLANKALVPIKNSWEKQRAFVADASHELRTPLAVMNTSMDIVLDNQAETIESQSKWLKNIQSEVLRMSKLVEDLLFLARSDSNEATMQMSKFDLSTSLIQLTEFFIPFGAEKGISISSKIEPNIYYFGNEGRIKQLVTILIDNAMQHSLKDGIIELAMKCNDTAIILSVHDNGSGIPEEHLSKIFERFYKVDKARSGNDNGSGLGLSIASCIAKEHNGSINVSSISSEGSTFKVILPLGKKI